MLSATHTLHNLTEFPARILVILIRIYQQTVSRILPPTCRFAPSCSEYAAQAVTRYGVWRGSWRALRRVLKCHPFHPGGYDPVD